MTNPAVSPYATLRVLQMVWSVNLVSIFLYGMALYAVVSPAAEGGFGKVISREPLVLTLQIGALILFFAAMAVSRLLLRKAAMLRARIAPTFELVSGARTALLIRWGMFEAIAVFGLVAAFIGGSRGIYLPFFLASIFGFVSSFPSERFIRAAQGEMV